MNHIKTLLCGNFVGIDTLERLKLMHSDPLFNEFDSFFVTNTELSPVEVVAFYHKRGNCENYNKEGECDMAVSHLLLQSFWSA